MALSMTGYGRGVKTVPEYSVTIDIKAVNHRYTELYIKIPKVYSFLEDKLRRDITARVSRGKLEVIVAIDKTVQDSSCVDLNQSIAASYIQAFERLQKDFNLDGRLDVNTLANLPNLFTVVQPADDQELLEKVLGEAAADALRNLFQMRTIEGNGLVTDIKSKIAQLEALRSDVAARAPQVVQLYRERLEKRVQELADGIEIDPNRIAMEVGLFADRSHITEELVRLESHLRQFLANLDGNEPVGRKLDFIIQEMNREINTIGSKANDIELSQKVIDAKVILEKIREQIQNIE